ncbi:uroporphyrinogen-III synthase [Neolewinella lacunae]|uniref:Uroporphyrinogen-III synthase n=1 Tax=Neolewinella lacunae TaxID=1517758 RepID=A0A923PIW1_9BACT|nr:uroporphyrinogen-III synthase [Neolewinella lacunae]MBC6993516.1 uroporphyrinogen-III synthase [Neolewinella lacunae]MDN3636208.1 uroporphyrinogen-III synthase [Neolewinella lacunae]
MTVFISRAVAATSPLLAWAEQRGATLLARSLLRFAALPFAAPEAADWWFFYSSRAVQFSAAALPTPRPRLAALGPGTAAALVARGLTPDFVGEGNPEAVASAFQDHCRGQRVFFPRARQSRQTVQRAIQDTATVLDAVCYDNVAVAQTEPILADVYIFTSPLNVAAYLDHQPLAPGARVLAIGPSTGAALAERGVECELAEQPGEEWVVAML